MRFWRQSATVRWSTGFLLSPVNCNDLNMWCHKPISFWRKNKILLNSCGKRIFAGISQSKRLHHHLGAADTGSMKAHFFIYMTANRPTCDLNVKHCLCTSALLWLELQQAVISNTCSASPHSNEENVVWLHVYPRTYFEKESCMPSCNILLIIYNKHAHTQFISYKRVSTTNILFSPVISSPVIGWSADAVGTGTSDTQYVYRLIKKVNSPLRNNFKVIAQLAFPPPSLPPTMPPTLSVMLVYSCNASMHSIQSVNHKPV